MTTSDDVRAALRNVVDPCSAATGTNLNIVEMGLVESIDVTDGHVQVDMRLTTPACQMVAYFMSEIENEVEPLPGVESVELQTDDGMEWSEEMLSADAKRRREELLAERRRAYERHVETADGSPEVAGQ